MLFVMDGVIVRPCDEASAGGPRAVAVACGAPLLTGACYRWTYEFDMFDVSLMQLTSCHLGSLLNVAGSSSNCIVRVIAEGCRLPRRGGLSVVAGSDCFAVVEASRDIEADSFLSLRSYGPSNPVHIDAVPWSFGLTQLE